MGLIVQKFGGTSVGTQEGRKAVLSRVSKAKKQGHDVVVVVSAMGRRGDPYATDTLIDLIKSQGKPVSAQKLDLIMSCGEIISAAFMSAYLESSGIKAEAMTGFQAGILTTADFGNAEILEVDTAAIKRKIQGGSVVVVAGFQGQTRNGEITTLGRGGSDITAVVLGKCLKADIVDIYTDVPGVAITDPCIVTEATYMDSISFEEMLLLAENGSKVVHPKAVRLAMEFDIPFKVKSTFEDGGTLISREGKNNAFPAIALQENITVMLYCKEGGFSCEEEMLLSGLGVGELFLHNENNVIKLLVSQDNLDKAVKMADDLKADLKLGEKVAKVSFIYNDKTLSSNTESIAKKIGLVFSRANIPILFQKNLPGHYIAVVPWEYSHDAVRAAYCSFFADGKRKAV
jgi:aspartate kinase